MQLCTIPSARSDESDWSNCGVRPATARAALGTVLMNSQCLRGCCEVSLTGALPPTSERRPRSESSCYCTSHPQDELNSLHIPWGQKSFEQVWHS